MDGLLGVKMNKLRINAELAIMGHCAMLGDLYTFRACAKCLTFVGFDMKIIEAIAIDGDVYLRRVLVLHIACMGALVAMARNRLINDYFGLGASCVPMTSNAINSFFFTRLA